MSYVETDFLLALVKEDDWLATAAEAYYETHADDLWTSTYTLVELMLVAYREDRNVEHVVANASALVEVAGDTDSVLAAANAVEEGGLTPFDALHLVAADGAPIVSSDRSYDDVTERVALEDLTD